MLSIIIVEPENDGNVGAIARAMMNFNFSDLILVNPKCDHLSETAINRARHADTILKKAKIVKKIPKMHTLIGTTARLGTDFNVPRSPMSPDQLIDLLPKSKQNMGLVFGRETTGLTNEEVQQCDFVVTIPTKREYQSLNLSHAVAILLYELYKHSGDVKPHEKVTMASEREKKQVIIMFKDVIGKLHFPTPTKKQTQLKVWKRIMGKSFLTKREAYALMGFFKQAKHALKKK